MASRDGQSGLRNCELAGSQPTERFEPVSTLERLGAFLRDERLYSAMSLGHLAP